MWQYLLANVNLSCTSVLYLGLNFPLSLKYMEEWRRNNLALLFKDWHFYIYDILSCVSASVLCDGRHWQNLCFWIFYTNFGIFRMDFNMVKCVKPIWEYATKFLSLTERITKLAEGTIFKGIYERTTDKKKNQKKKTVIPLH